MFDPIQASQNIKDEFTSYVSTSFHLADKEYAEKFRESLNEEGLISKGPYIDISDSFETGNNIETLITEGIMSPLFNDLEKNIPEGDKEIKLQRKLYKHQETAIRKIRDNKNIVVTTGTGSGKTECFVLPIIDHLLREKSEGKLLDGVRAILIYPMNALANDQMKRLRVILAQYPSITFGVYNSSTKQEDKAGIAEYGRVFKDADGKPAKPLKNELISRTAMQKTPPHILVTNYAMLEYMMLRPNDDLVFSRAKLRFLVLDEAHIYRGATGIETSLLLRRLKARISNSENVIHVLTSATLGGEEVNKDIVSFAENLCAAKFGADDIIRSKTIMPEFPKKMYDIPMEVFEKLAHPQAPLNRILEEVKGFKYESGIPDSEIIYNFCLSSNVYRILRQCADHPMTVLELTAKMQEYIDITADDVINLISVASVAEKNKTALIKARYHMFVRALEGAYITLDERKSVSLTRKNYIYDNGKEYRLFEAAACDDCGRIGIAGKVENDHLEFSSNRFEDDIDIFLLRKQNEMLEELDDDDIDEETESIEKNDFVICSHCGEIHHESVQEEFKCDCNRGGFKRIRKAVIKGIKREHRCPACNLGHMKLFYLGYDAATAVLGTELFEQLPESEIKLESKVETVEEDNPFALAKASRSLDIVKKKRQFLSFSDSRSEAAYFASYMTTYYKEFLRRRGLWHVIKKNELNISKNPWEINTLIEELTAYFDSNRTFAEPGDDGKSNLTPVSRRQAWIAVLNEMVNARRTTSLVSLGVLDFEYKGNNLELMGRVGKQYGKSAEDSKAIFDLLVNDIVYNGAIEPSDCKFTDDEREYIYYVAKPRRFVKCKDADKDKKKNHINGWIPRVRENGTTIKNGRVQRLVKQFGVSEEDAKKLLDQYWEGILFGGEYPLTPEGNGEYFISTDMFCVHAGTEQRPIYVCEKCGKTTMINCMDQCTLLKCDGKLKKIEHDDLIKDNHFAKLYSDEQMKPLHIKEHTAQLGRKEQQKYQEMFVNKDINALSCSTTFEMGVDVGDLETVYLRNMPPSPANYVQRAGRAGRSIHSAAYSLTYSKLSSHDFTYFAGPEKMISGEIGVPLFSISNYKVIIRHIFAVALSDFFAANPDIYNSNNADELLNGDGYEQLKEFINSKPASLRDLLERSIPVSMHDEMGIKDFSWKEQLIGESGALEEAVNDYRETIAYYESEYTKQKKKGDIQAAARTERQLKNFRRGKEDERGRNELIEFLVRNNILPKYGFPVDTVELHQGISNTQDNRLQMVRDLQLAISEYAPDAEVVADGKLYTSRYIRKLPQSTGQDWKEVYIGECGNQSCKTWNHRTVEPSSDGELCVSCNSVIERAKWLRAIEPRKGFVADSKPKEVPLRKPDRMYRSQDYYIGDTSRRSMKKLTFEINGDSKIQMETSANDALMVVCNDSFYVCDKCGYSVSSSSEKNAKGFNANKRSYEKNHETSWGRMCKGKLYQSRLCHSFKTDVVKLVFGTAQAKSDETMLSVMYALLEALSMALDIERTDIKGCLHKVRYERGLIYEIVLYDAVAGGAGHVRRLVTDECDVFQEVVQRAINLTKNCNCDPSCYNCLRNYYNQSFHDMLNRQMAYQFLEHYIGNAVRISDDEFEKLPKETKEDIDESAVVMKGGTDCSSYRNWHDMNMLIPQELKETTQEFDKSGIRLPSSAYIKCHLKGEKDSIETLFVWNDKKIIVFDKEEDIIKVKGWKVFTANDLGEKEFSAAFK